MSASLARLQQSHGVTIVWRSYELRPAGSPPIPPWYQERIAAMRPQFEAMAKQQYGLEIRSGPFGINSRPALIGAKYAESQGVGAAYHDAVFRAYWQQSRDIQDIDVLIDIAQAVGLETEAFRTALDEAAHDESVSGDVAQAMAMGIEGVPALLFAGRYLVNGAQPYETLVRVMQQVEERLKQEPPA